jgi:hypothetical protein
VSLETCIRCIVVVPVRVSDGPALHSGGVLEVVAIVPFAIGNLKDTMHLGGGHVVCNISAFLCRRRRTLDQICFPRIHNLVPTSIFRVRSPKYAVVIL